MFHTALYNVKSPQNVGMITRTHFGLGGDKLICIVDGTKPWTYNDTSKYWSRGIYKYCDVQSFTNVDEFFQWAKEDEKCEVVALEISENSVMLPNFEFTKKPIILIGNETVGIPKEILQKCDKVVTIPQYGAVGSLNVSAATAIVLYEVIRQRGELERMIKINDHCFDAPLTSMDDRRSMDPRYRKRNNNNILNNNNNNENDADYLVSLFEDQNTSVIQNNVNNEDYDDDDDDDEGGDGTYNNEEDDREQSNSTKNSDYNQ